MEQTPNAAAIVISLLAAACTILLILGFRYGMRHSSFPPSKQKNAVARAGIAIALWVVIVGWLARVGFFSNFEALPPRLLLAVVLPAIALAAVSFGSSTLTEALSNTPIAWLFYLQTFRIIVEIVLWRGYKGGFFPVQMTFEGRNFDILAGLTAPIAGWIWQRTHNRIIGIVWNFAGLALLLNIIVVAILSMPTPLRVFTDGPANTLLAQFPFIYLPALLVPIAYTLHILSLRQLWTRPKPSKIPARD